MIRVHLVIYDTRGSCVVDMGVINDIHSSYIEEFPSTDAHTPGCASAIATSLGPCRGVR